MSTTAYHLNCVDNIRRLADAAHMTVKISRRDSQLLDLVPRSTHLSVFTRDAVLATGTVEELLVFLQGWRSHEQYLLALKVIDRHRVNQAEIKNLAKIERERDAAEKRKIVAILRAEDVNTV